MRRYAPILAALSLMACGPGARPFSDPRAELQKLGVPYNADALVAQAGQGDVTAVKLLLASGMPPDAKDSHGDTALTSAAAGGHLSVVKLLVDKGARVDPPNPDGPTPLTAAAWGGYFDVVDALLSKGAHVNANDGARHSALMEAV